MWFIYESVKRCWVIFCYYRYFLCVVGTIKYILVLNDIEKRIYTTATIVEINEYLTGDPDNPNGFVPKSNVLEKIYVEKESLLSALIQYYEKYK